jgi:Domain of unknown function (DUF4389)
VSGYPVHVVVTDDLRRSRLTVFFRLLLALPHFLWLTLWGIAALVAWIANWFATLVAGRSPDGLHAFLARFLRYGTHVNAYAYLLADPYPGFGGAPGYPVDVEVDPPVPQSRTTVFFRIVLAIPALLIARILGYLLQLLAFLGWFVCLFSGRMPKGMRDLGVYCLRYDQQTIAYVLLLTGRYPPLSSPD